MARRTVKEAEAGRAATKAAKKAAVVVVKKRINSRAKGAAGERELANWLKERGYEARRGQQFSGGSDSPDVVCDALAGFHIECKRVEAGNLYTWMAQAVRDAGDIKIPLVIHRRNKKDWVAILPLDALISYIQCREI